MSTPGNKSAILCHVANKASSETVASYQNLLEFHTFSVPRDDCVRKTLCFHSHF